MATAKSGKALQLAVYPASVRNVASYTKGVTSGFCDCPMQAGTPHQIISRDSFRPSQCRGNTRIRPGPYKEKSNSPHDPDISKTT